MTQSNEWKKKYLNKVVHGDCMDVMKELPDNCIDLVLTDPPYGLGEKLKGGRNFSMAGAEKWDFVATREQIEENIRVSTNQIIWGANHFEFMPRCRTFLIWDKKQPEGCSFSMVEYAWTSFDSPPKAFYSVPDRDKSVRFHPTQKPVELMVWCLENYLLKNWKEDRRPIVFDGFAGSGTTAVACKKCGCDYILIEKEADYVDICNKRLAQETLF